MNNSIADLKLFMILLGSTPEGRRVEQHDYFFGIASSLGQLVPEIKSFWPEAKDSLHIDAWREVSVVDGYQVKITPRNIDDNSSTHQITNKLFFINLGGYQENIFEEQHYTILTVQKSKALAFKEAKSTFFFQEHGFGKAAASHLDNKYGIDVDNLYQIDDILSSSQKEKYQIELIPTTNSQEDDITLGYLKISQLELA